MVRRLASVLVLAVLVGATPSAAKGIGLAPRLRLGMVVEDGPAGAGGPAVGWAGSVGLRVGVPVLSAIADVGMRQASIPSASLKKGWSEYETSDVTVTAGLRSQHAVAKRWDVAVEGHVGASEAEVRAKAGGVSSSASERFFLWGGVGEVMWSPKRALSLGLRVGFDRFVPTEEDGAERTSWTFGPVIGLHLG